MRTLFREGNYGEAVALFSAGAREGNTRALFNLAYCLQYGYGVQADPARAFGLYQHLLYEEDGDAAYNAAAMLLTGRGVPCDPRAGYELMLTAAEQDCIEAQLYVAMVRLTGCVGEPDTPSIRRIPFHKPDRREAAPLLESVGAPDERLMDRRFEIVDADEEEAIYYMRKAAHNQGDYTGTSVGDAEASDGRWIMARRRNCTSVPPHTAVLPRGKKSRPFPPIRSSRQRRACA